MALQSVSLEVPRGQTLGILGRNGSGKSTLLQIIAGILKPTTGDLKVNGRVSALLELGSGFNPEFSGRENVIFQAQVLGVSDDEIQRRLPDIEAYADIGEFFDQPVKTYSSGMFVRVAFSAATSIDPDI
jgi:lipopolysaccharide transport system ATP-binding protein